MRRRRGRDRAVPDELPADGLPADELRTDGLPTDELPAILVGGPAVALGGQVRRGVVWTAGSRVLVQLLQVAATAVLARLLSPADYGLSALVAVITGFAGILVDLGIAASVIRRPGLDGRYLDTAFWLNFGVGIGIAALVCGAAVPTAAFFDQPDLVGLMLLSSLTFVLSLNSVHVSVMQRALAFATIGRMTVVTTTVGLVVSIAAAALGMGAASLVLGPVVQRATSVVQVWFAVRWIPRWRFSRADAKDIWAFGRGLTGSNVVTYWVTSADRVLLGKAVQVAELGFYNRASNLMQLPLQQTTRTLSTVFYPALATMTGDPARLRRAWLRLVRAAWIVGLPAGVGLVLTAGDAVPVLYGAGWDPVVPLLGVLSAGVPFLVLGMTAGPAFQALGRTGLQFRIGLIGAVIALAALAVGIHWGAMGVAVAVVVRGVVQVVLAMGVLLPVLGLPVRGLLAVLWRSALAGLTMAGAVWGAVLVTGDLHHAPALAIEMAVGVLAYGAVAWWLERDMLRELLGRRRPKKATGDAHGRKDPVPGDGGVERG